MQSIQPMDSIVARLLPPQAVSSETAWRPLRFLVQQPVDSGTLVFNVMTRELVLLTPQEADWLNHPDSLAAPHGLRDALANRYLIVPQQFNEFQITHELREMASVLQRRVTGGKKTTFTILPTTDCNARCFYCYEKGCAKITMTDETARAVAEHVLKVAVPEAIRLRWFGGEPLLNANVIDLICQNIAAAGRRFSSHIITNGYLFNDDMVKRAVSLWALKKAQITLDGTEDVYNRRKAYIHAGQDSPFQRVLDNVQRLLEAGVKVSVRMNVDSRNAQDIEALIALLAKRFGGHDGFSAYVSPLFDDLDGEDSFEDTYRRRQVLQEKLDRLIPPKRHPSLPKEIRIHACMADSETAEVILPDGRLCTCEHIDATGVWGTLADESRRNLDVLTAWRQSLPPLPECQTCALFPDCIRLTLCNNQIRRHCSALERQRRLNDLALAMKEFADGN